MLITTLQLAQMVIGGWVNYQAWQYKAHGETCQVTDENLKVSLAMYGTYFLLFAHFFLGSYVFRTKRSSKSDDQHQEEKQSKAKQN